MMKFLRKYHRWAGLILVFFLLLFSVSGIILNHRETFSAIDIHRNFLPSQYRYQNWNNASVKASLKLSKDSILLYGTIGVWLSDSLASDFVDFNSGFPLGIDNRKIHKLIRSSDGKLLAATQFGLFVHTDAQWRYVELPVYEKNVVDLVDLNDSLLVMTRSHLLSTTNLRDFRLIHLPPPVGYDNKIGLFKTLWVIHSGEIYGIAGKLIVDAIALILVFLSLTGLIIWIKKEHLQVKHRLKKGMKFRKRHVILRKIIWSHHQEDKYIRKSYQWNLKWHNKIGWMTLVLLIITVFTGMFLRPPFLIGIGDTRVNKIPYTELASDNAWFDILRRIIWLEDEKIVVLSTFDGFYYTDRSWKEIKTFEIQAPASVMGVTVLEKSKNGLMVGSFEGLFDWNLKSGEIYDLLKEEIYVKPLKKGPPVGDFKVSGFSNDFSMPIVFDYSRGALYNLNIEGNENLQTKSTATNLHLESNPRTEFTAIHSESNPQPEINALHPESNPQSEFTAIHSESNPRTEFTAIHSESNPQPEFKALHPESNPRTEFTAIHSESNPQPEFTAIHSESSPQPEFTSILPDKLMKEEMKEANAMSLWNFMLEVHTGRIFQFILGPLYILIVPLVGLATLILSISGFIVWWKYYRK